MEQHAGALAHHCLVPSGQRVPTCWCHFLVHVHLQGVKWAAILLMFMNTSSYDMTQRISFHGKDKRRIRKGSGVRIMEKGEEG